VPCTNLCVAVTRAECSYGSVSPERQYHLTPLERSGSHAAWWPHHGWSAWLAGCLLGAPCLQTRWFPLEPEPPSLTHFGLQAAFWAPYVY
jgi:hypothetical protein